VLLTVADDRVDLPGRGDREAHIPRMLILPDDTIARDVLEAVKAMHGSTTLLAIAHSDRTLAACDRIFRLDAKMPRVAYTR
jgi:hypothetical protein